MKTWISAVTLIGLLTLVTQCSGSADNGSENNTASGEVAASNTATQAVTDGMTTAIGSVIAGGGAPALVKATLDEDSDESYSCSYHDEDNSVTCDCPRGGSVTYGFEEAFEFSEEGDYSFDHTYRASFDECVIESCGSEHTLNGEVTGNVSGSYSEDGSISIEVSHQTAAECSGMSVDDLNIGFDMNMSYDGTDEEVFGTICFDPPGDVIEFNSLDELEEIVDPDLTCDAAEHESDDESDEDEEDDDGEDESAEHDHSEDEME